MATEEVIKGEVQVFEILVKSNKETGPDEPSHIFTNRIHTIDKNIKAN